MDQDGLMDGVSESSGSDIILVRDNDFYHERGDCFVVVGETIFKIHRYLLASDGSAFAEIFSFLDEDNSPTSLTEDHPIRLEDSVYEFRALCWALYALPLEIDAQNGISSFLPNFKRVLDLFSISHKYDFESLATWAKRLLVHHCTPCDSADDENQVLDSPSCKIPDLELMLRLSTRADLDALSEAAENALMRRLKSLRDINSVSLSRNLLLAEELGLRKFQGRLYYHELLNQESYKSTIEPSTARLPHPANTLTEKQCCALFRGYWSLSRYWKAFPLTIAPLPSLTSCAKHEDCEAEWVNIWSVDNFIQKVDFPWYYFDPLQKLERILSPHTLPLFTGSSLHLGPCGLNELRQIIKQLRDTLADHFLGPQV